MARPPRVAGRAHVTDSQRLAAYRAAAAHEAETAESVADALTRAAAAARRAHQAEVDVEEEARVGRLLRYLAPFSGVSGARRQALARARIARRDAAIRAEYLAAQIPDQRRPSRAPSPYLLPTVPYSGSTR